MEQANSGCFSAQIKREEISVFPNIIWAPTNSKSRRGLLEHTPFSNHSVISVFQAGSDFVELSFAWSLLAFPWKAWSLVIRRVGYLFLLLLPHWLALPLSVQPTVEPLVPCLLHLWSRVSSYTCPTVNLKIWWVSKHKALKTWSHSY